MASLSFILHPDSDSQNLRGPLAACASFAESGPTGSPQPAALLGSQTFESAPRKNTSDSYFTSVCYSPPEILASSGGARIQPGHGCGAHSVLSLETSPGKVPRVRQAATPVDDIITFTASLPGSGPIDVSFDRTTASAKQSVKRSRNAKASGRHRSKKKAELSDLQKEIQALKDAAESQKAEMDSIKRQLDFYCKIVRRTPHIARWADGPQSPILSGEGPTKASGNTRHQDAFASPLVSITPFPGQAEICYPATELPSPQTSISVTYCTGIFGEPLAKGWKRGSGFEYGCEESLGAR